jgi:hypothetical protein
MAPEAEVALVDRLIQGRSTPQSSGIITIAPEHGTQKPEPMQRDKGSACEQRCLCFANGMKRMRSCGRWLVKMRQRRGAKLGKQHVFVASQLARDEPEKWEQWRGLKIFPAQKEAYSVKASRTDTPKVLGDFGGIEVAPPVHSAADRPIVDAETKSHVCTEAGARP